MSESVPALTSTNTATPGLQPTSVDVLDDPATAPALGAANRLESDPGETAEVLPAEPPLPLPLPAGPGLDGMAVQRVAAAAGRARAANTTRAYAADWHRFSTWCGQRDLNPLPAAPQVLAAYLAEMAETRSEVGERAFSPSTLTRWVAAINAAHAAAGYAVPGQAEVVRATLSGIKRGYAQAGERRVQRRAPLLLEDIREILQVARREARSWVAQVTERRDSALILIGFAGAFRRSELVAISTQDVRWHPQDGLHVRLGKSKTDQEGAGEVKALPFGRAHLTCPVGAYTRWRQVLDAWDTDGRVGVLKILRQTRDFDEHVCRDEGSEAGFTTLPHRRWVFRGVHKTGAVSASALSGQAINPMLHRRAQAAGIDPQLLRLLGGHSLRVGFVTQAVRNGASTQTVMAQTGHTDERMVSVYARRHAGLIGNAVTHIGL